MSGPLADASSGWLWLVGAALVLGWLVVGWPYDPPRGFLFIPAAAGLVALGVAGLRSPPLRAPATALAVLGVAALGLGLLPGDWSDVPLGLAVLAVLGWLGIAAARTPECP